MDSFPAFLPLAGRRVIIVGYGEAADAKARLFEGSPAVVERVVDPALAGEVKTYARALLVFVAEADEALARIASGAARTAGALVNVVDRPTLSDFTTPALVDRGSVVAAIGTGGASPLLASLLRNDIEARMPEGAGRVAALLARLQGEVRAAFPDLAQRRAFLRQALSSPAAEAALAGDTILAEQRLRDAIAAAQGFAGRIRYVDGRAPADLLTLRALRALSEADVLVCDPDVAADVLTLARRDARRIQAAGPALAALAQGGQQVVRLTGAASPAAEIEQMKVLGLEPEILARAPAD